MKTDWKKLMLKATVLAAAAMVLTSCGKDTENQVIADTNNPVAPTPVDPIIIDGVGLDFWNNAKTQNACPYGSSRMADRVFNLQGSAYQAQISGMLQSGHVSGTVTQTYTGMNIGTKDLIFISQVNNGSSIAYNVVVSLCTWNNGQIEFIGESAGLSHFRLQYMTLSQSTNCPTGKVLDGWLTFNSQTYAQASYTNGDVPTRFAPLSSSCN